MPMSSKNVRAVLSPMLSFLLRAVLAAAILGNAVWFGLLAEAPRLPCLAIGIVLILIGVRFFLQGLAGFRHCGTPVLPYKPALALVTSGIFARTRNPMYQGVGIGVLGLAFLLRSDGLILVLMLLAPVAHYGLVLPEERYLERRFGPDFLRFAEQVPRYGWQFWPLVGAQWPAKDWLVWTIPAAGLVVAVHVIPWLTDLVMEAVEEPGVRTAALAGASVTGRASLLAAAREAGLRPSSEIKVITGGISRSDDGRVRINGWAAEIGGGGSPLAILVFTDGSLALQTKTAGEQPEVTRLLGLSAQAARNVVFDGTMACRRRHRLIVVAASIGNKYAALSPLTCP